MIVSRCERVLQAQARNPSFPQFKNHQMTVSLREPRRYDGALAEVSPLTPALSTGGTGIRTHRVVSATVLGRTGSARLETGRQAIAERHNFGACAVAGEVGVVTAGGRLDLWSLRVAARPGSR